LAAGFCPKNLAFARKIMVLPESGGCSPPARTPMKMTPYSTLETLVPVRSINLLFTLHYLAQVHS